MDTHKHTKTPCINAKLHLTLEYSEFKSRHIGSAGYYLRTFAMIITILDPLLLFKFILFFFFKNQDWNQQPCPPNSHEHCNLSLKDHLWLNKDFKLLTVNNIIEVKRIQSLLKLPIFLQDIKADSASKLLHWN